ncbi:MAG: hypothetical protein ACFCUQ_14965 [Kiloniellales bacterium]
MGPPREHRAARRSLAFAALVLGLAACAGEPEPAAAPPVVKPVETAKPKAPGEPTLGDVVDEVLSRRKVIEKLEEIERNEP